MALQIAGAHDGMPVSPTPAGGAVLGASFLYNMFEAVRAAWEKVHAENETRDAIKAGMKAQEAWEKFGVL